MTGRSARRALAVTALALCPSAREAGAALYSIRTDGALLTIEPSNGAVLSSVPITVAGDSVVNGNGLASASTGTLWGLLTLFGQPGRELVTIDPSNGVATRIGDTGNFFSALAFDGSGTLYGLTGFAAIQPAILYRLDTTTAAAESVLALTSAGGHAIAFDHDDGLLYHATGGLLEKVDLDLATITPVPTSGYPWFSAQGMTYTAGGSFLFTANFGLYLNLTSSGFADSLGTTAPSKGLAFSPVGTGAPLSAHARELHAWPNPLRGGTLRVSSAHLDGETPDLAIHDVTGRLVRLLRASATASPRDATWRWDGRDDRGRAVPSGAYFVRPRGEDASGSARIVVLR